ncbi:hypothetical protein B0H10DRAFT_2208997 [Mycena sp. CBHHK59/15]|nr:hypothetical protein B0H10DRAFT_2208997 [Mycena sp. CBHHK59/15]
MDAFLDLATLAASAAPDAPQTDVPLDADSQANYGSYSCLLSRRMDTTRTLDTLILVSQYHYAFLHPARQVMQASAPCPFFSLDPQLPTPRLPTYPPTPVPCTISVLCANADEVHLHSPARPYTSFSSHLDSERAERNRLPMKPAAHALGSAQACRALNG